MAFTKSHSKSTNWVTFSVSISNRPDDLSPDHLPVRDLRPFPTATSGIHASGVFPAAKPARLIDESCPHGVGEFLLATGCPAAASSARFDFRALIRAAIRCD
jgi:hypothetical protein